MIKLKPVIVGIILIVAITMFFPLIVLPYIVIDMLSLGIILSLLVTGYIGYKISENKTNGAIYGIIIGVISGFLMGLSVSIMYQYVAASVYVFYSVFYAIFFGIIGVIGGTIGSLFIKNSEELE
ncbi:hypothetical protein Metbo_1996 [Methanobacterium lacus]|uniref:DUF5518 domain-containing protein n=1 Tax=Methanobacterium lacus (strain AL-21) TaxID=877455 RepID=F0TBE6_METLA|nr:hypothetical protein [Methanobacterium lacus]ADZ10215.1 hypothetical protein Metbo_1996 [Methanobacterium lacus]